VSVLSHGMSSPAQALSLFFHLNHIHLRRRDLPNHSGSGIPRPPLSFGRQVIDQFTRQCPPLTISGSSPLHRNDLSSACQSFLSDISVPRRQSGDILVEMTQLF
jgi:hypothetical protein